VPNDLHNQPARFVDAVIPVPLIDNTKLK
jgi:hypothetical protein